MSPTFDTEDFQVWRDHPVTQAFFAFLTKEAVTARENFVNAAWEGRFDPVQHAATRGAAEAINQIVTLTWEDINASVQ